jgi:flagellar hook-length control protein FliK
MISAIATSVGDAQLRGNAPGARGAGQEPGDSLGFASVHQALAPRRAAPAPSTETREPDTPDADQTDSDPEQVDAGAMPDLPPENATAVPVGPTGRGTQDLTTAVPGAIATDADSKQVEDSTTHVRPGADPTSSSNRADGTKTAVIDGPDQAQVDLRSSSGQNPDGARALLARSASGKVSHDGIGDETVKTPPVFRTAMDAATNTHMAQGRQPVPTLDAATPTLAPVQSAYAGIKVLDASGKSVADDSDRIADTLPDGRPMVGPAGSLHGTQAGSGPQAAQADAPVRSIAAQMTVALAQSSDGKTDIILNPAELGRVRLQLSTHANTINLVILADRPETTEMLRRHIDALAQEFRALGYGAMSFSFSGNTRDGATQQAQGQSRYQPAAETTADNAPNVARRHIADGLDLRL